MVAFAPPRPETSASTALVAAEAISDRSTSPWGNRATRVMSRRNRRQCIALAVIWVLCSAYFWLWWLHPAHAGNPLLFAGVSAGFFYTATVLPSVYLFFLWHMHRPVPTDPYEAEALGVIGRVAVITLTVPGSESLAIVRRQLQAMAAIRYPHDDWILVDKQHSPAIERLAQEFGVQYFCRHD